ncbi:MAG TPA: oligosaccharide flippase family protein [Acidobacteriaceae bacterium]|nr:oligosaccharide flippase family protein [Acidobacteriaceae bacterium]
MADGGPGQNAMPLHARIVSGSFVLLLGSGVATLTNFIYNVAVARFLGPAGYGHAAAVYTLLVLISAATLSFQIVAAKVVAQQPSLEAKRAVYRSVHRAAWTCGVLVAILLLLCQKPIAAYLNLPGPILVALLAAGAAFYVPLGARRGYMQGVCGFRALAINLVLEGIGRLGGSLLLMHLGWGVRGVVAANAAAVAIAWLAAVPLHRVARIANPLLLHHALRETQQAIVFFSGQVLINNCDIVLVKHFFLPAAAGLYAAVAMVGRVIFTFSSAVVNSMFPIVAGTRQEERRALRVIATSSLLVVGIGGVLALGLRVTPAWVWTRFFGSGFALRGPYGLPWLLSMYAVTTILYCLSVVIITYEMSWRIANTGWIQLAFSGVVIAGICLFHSSLREVIWVQLILMVALLLVVGVPFLVSALSEDKLAAAASGTGPIRILRPVPEEEVIAEFLRNDFNSPAFYEYRNALRELVMIPDLSDPAENAKRRALLFIRHLALWKELPEDTRWFEVELRRSELRKVRVFPRAQWRKLAQGNYSITAVADRMRTQSDDADAPFRGKIDAIRARLAGEDPEIGAVVLIGVDAKEPVTVLDGNHRLMAAILSAPARVERLRFLCGLSPRMSECCWYNTNLVTLTRYAKNVLAHMVRDPEAELARLLETG